MTDLYRTEKTTLIAPDGTTAEAVVTLLCEHELSIIVNERHAMRLVCTKQHLSELIMGRILTGGFIDSAEDVNEIVFNTDETEACVILNNDAAAGDAKDRRAFRKLRRPDVQPGWIFAMAEEFEKDTALHDMTSCTHSCMLSRKGEILFACEDIGRHNAVDKAVGYALQARIDLSECIIYTSGRVPVDMAEKSIAAGIPVLASKSVPTAEAVDLAGQYGLVLIGSARPDSMKLYT